MTERDMTHRPGPPDRHPAECAALVRERSSVAPRVAVVVGSGLQEAVADLRPDAEISYESLPGFPPPSVPGHAGRLAMGELFGVPAAVFLGRVHLYEGHGVASTTLIARLAAELGARAIVLTNASGGLAPSLSAGDLLLIRDHINLLGVNPLTGWRFPTGLPAFVDLSAVYSTKAMVCAEEAARAEGVALTRGVYAAVPGPTYETPAETEFLRRAGADAVGMSTVPEAVAAVALELEVCGISCITNMAGSSGGHDDVLAAAARAARQLRVVLAQVVPAMAG
jgi:purine-nucleoside phosphorylase